jgi:malate dehydrogenase
MKMPKISVIGAGHVGATTAHLLALKGLGDVTLIDVVDGLAQGKALDITQSAPVEGFSVHVQGSTDLAALEGSRLVIITAGMARKPGMSRDDLLAANANIVGPIADQIKRAAPNAIVIVVTNPLDVMTALTLDRTGFARTRVMGMAGVLDTSRLRAFIGMRLGVPPSDVEAMVLGSHGDLMVPIRSSITVHGVSASALIPAQELEQILQRTKEGGAEIVKYLKQGSAFYAPASGAVEMAASILRDAGRVLPVCVRLNGEFGIRDVCVGVPAKLGAAGVERVVEIPLDTADRAALSACAEQVRGMTQGLAALPGKAS